MPVTDSATHQSHEERSPRTLRPLATGVLHFGLGAFHRAHQAHFFNRLLTLGHRDWGIASVNLRSPGIVEALRAQENLYTRWERGRDTESFETIGALTGSYHLPTMRADVLALFRDPNVRLITVTVSEKGYHFDRDRSGLADSDPEILADLADPSVAATLPGLLAQGLDARRRSGAGPVTVLSCDNYQRNGVVLKSVVTGFAQSCYPDLSGWVEDNVRFPSSMVDEIVPKVRDEDRAALARISGKTDPALVIAEDYTRWVIEDDFAAERPPFETVGVEIVADVEPYEAMKLLLLNAPHSALAYLGAVAGFDYIHEAVANPTLRATVRGLMRDELMPVAQHTAKAAAHEYGGRTLDRFANPNIAYLTRQVATDGSLKLRQRVVPAVNWHLARERLPDGLALVLAAWMRFLHGQTDQGVRYEISDPMADILAACCRDANGNADFVARLLGLRSIFPAEIGARRDLAERIAWHLDGLTRRGTLLWLDDIRSSTGRETA